VFVKEINDFCRDRLYPKEKFLRKNWQEYLPNDRRSLYSVCMKLLSIPEGSDKREIWSRVIVPSIRYKYQSMKCNMNNKIKNIDMSMRIIFEYATKDILIQRSHNKIIATVYISTGDVRVVEPDPLSEGFSRYAACNMEHFVFEFLLNYVRRMRSDLNWSKLLQKNPERPFLLFITPSDIVYVLALIKNGMAIWDQAPG